MTRECEEIEPSDLADRLVVADELAHLAEVPQQVIRLAVSEGLTPPRSPSDSSCRPTRSGATSVEASWSCASDWRCFTMHADPELLSLLALGEQVGTDDDRFHVQTCPTCADEVSELRRLVSLVRSLGPSTDLTRPRPSASGPGSGKSSPCHRPWSHSSPSIPVVDAAPAPVPTATHADQSLLAVVAAALRGPSAAPPPSWPTRPWRRSGQLLRPYRVRR